jgi:UDP-GlcNAc:undecaprenyl-phosphate GlcNAc-1-phosphate transferase
MTTYLSVFFGSFLVAGMLTLFVRNRAYAHGWFDDTSSSRKIHVRPIPRLGGIGIVVGFFAPILVFLALGSDVGRLLLTQPRMVLGLFLGGSAIALLGLYDDIRGSRARNKLAVQALIAVAMWLLDFRIEIIANPFGPPIQLGIFALPFTLLWIVGVVNAMNLVDGLDGLAGGVAFFAVATNFMLALARGEALLGILMAALAGAILGFLILNFNPASIFMGDTGSMFLGFVLATVSIKTSAKAGTTVAMLVPVIALGLPIMDTLLAVIRRTLLGRPVFRADRDHIHHRLMTRLPLSHRGAVLVLYGFCCLFALAGLALAYANSVQTTMLLVGISAVVFVLMRQLGYFSLDAVSGAAATRRRNVKLRRSVRRAIDALAAAPTLTDIWEAVRPLQADLEASFMELRIEGPLAGQAQEFRAEETAAEAVLFSTRFEVGEGDDRRGFLSVGWADGRTAIDRDEELAVELIADAVGGAAARLSGRARPNIRVVR